MRKILPLMVLFSPLYSSYDYHMQMSFRRGPTPMDSRIEYKVNEQDVTCECGRKPVFSMFFYGRPEHFCEQHIPEIERVTRITEESVQQLLDSLRSAEPKVGPHNWNHSGDDVGISEMNMNGAHVGVDSAKK